MKQNEDVIKELLGDIWECIDLYQKGDSEMGLDVAKAIIEGILGEEK